MIFFLWSGYAYKLWTIKKEDVIWRYGIQKVEEKIKEGAVKGLAIQKVQQRQGKMNEVVHVSLSWRVRHTDRDKGRNMMKFRMSSS